MTLRNCLAALMLLSITSLTPAIIAADTDSTPSPGAAEAPSEHSPLKLIPWPKSVKLGDGSLTLTSNSRIVAATPDLEPLAVILSDDIDTTVGLRMKVAQGDGAAGDIVLRVNPQLKADNDILALRDRQLTHVHDFADQVSVTDRVLVQGWDYRAVAEGTATVLQLLDSTGGKITVPDVEIRDWPYADFTGAMVDTARQYNSIEDLKKMVILCHVYKVRYFDLHLTDDQGWTFPSTAFPRLGTQNVGAHAGPAPRLYTLAQLRDLVKFADARGVTLIPEIEMPGHSGQAQGTMPEIFGYTDPATGKSRALGMMNIANPRLYTALDTLIGETLDVFKSSPYFDMGFDEVSGLENVVSTPQGKAFMKEKNLANGGDLVNYFALAVNDMVKKRGKKTLQWGGMAQFASPDIIVFSWDGGADQLQARHIPTITVPWNLGVPWPQWSMFACNGAMLPRTDQVLGACLPAWEQRGDVHVRWLRGLGRRQERTWGPDNLFTADGFNRRQVPIDAMIDRLIYGFTAGHDVPVDADFFRNRITKATKLTLSPAPGIGIVHFTTDGTEPTAASPVFSNPLLISDSLTVKARLYGRDGKPLNDTWVQPYEFDPLSAKASNLAKNSEGKEVPWFVSTSDVTLESATPGGSIRYTLDGSDPTANSPVYVHPITLKKTTTIKARWFDGRNLGRGDIMASHYDKFAGLESASVGKPLTLLLPAKIDNKAQIEKLLTDGLLMRGQEWGGSEVARFEGKDMEVVIDLQKPVQLQKIGGRFLYAQEIGIFPPSAVDVSISSDGKNFKPLASAHFTPPPNVNDRGVTIKVMEVDGGGATARYVKILAKNIGVIPDWHPVRGVPAWLMCDEVFVNPTDDPAKPK